MPNPVCKAWCVEYKDGMVYKIETVYGDDIFIVADRLQKDLRLNKFTITLIQRDEAYDLD